MKATTVCEQAHAATCAPERGRRGDAGRGATRSSVQRRATRRSRISASARAGAARASACRRSRRAMPVKRMRAGEERRDRDFVGGVQHRGRGAAGAQRRVGEAPGTGKRSRSGRSNARRVTPREVERPRRPSRCARDRPSAWAIGMRMSGLPSCASTEPSTYSTSECMMLCGWITTSMRSAGSVEQPVRLDHLEALVHHRRRVDRDLAAHHPVRMRAGLARA